MHETRLRTHPAIVIAATTVILTCLIAVAVMLGIIPSPLVKGSASGEADINVNAPAHRPPHSEERDAPDTARTHTRDTAVETPLARGGTRSTAPSQTVAGSEPAPRVAAVCTNCGTVTSVQVVKQQGEAGLLGPAAGTAVGGLVGSQIGSGSGKTIATIVGAAGGAAVGTELERRYKATTQYIVGVRLNDGTTRRFTYGSAPGLREGDKVKVVEGRLVRDA